MKGLHLVLAVGTGFLILPAISRGSTIVTDAGTPQTSSYGGTVGYEFDLSSGGDQPLDALGMYYGSGLTAAHDVGLWTAGGTLLAEASVGPAGTPDSAGFIFTPVTPADYSNGFDGTLVAGTVYRIGADYSTGDDYVNDNGSAAFDPAVTVTASYYSSTNGFAFPTQKDNGATGYIGPNAVFGTVVPEPASLGILAGSAILLISRRRTRTA